MTRRANGEGSVYRRASDGKWVGALTVAGKRKVVYGRSQREVRDKLRAVTRDLDAGLDLEAATVTVGSYLADWSTRTLNARVKAGVLAPRTLESYADTVSIHISPYIGLKRLRDLRPSDLREWLSDLQDAHQAPRCPACAALRRKGTDPARCERHAATTTPVLSARSIRYAHAVLRAALSDAVDEQLVARNVAMMVSPPSAVSAQLVPLSAAEAGRLLAAASEDRLRVLWLTLLGLGLRRGEALALRWEDLDLAAGTVTIRRSLQRMRTTGPDGTPRTALASTPTKTLASQATLVLPSSLTEALRAHRLAQRTEAVAALAWSDTGLVFATSVGTALEPRNVARSWAALCKKAEVRPLRLHDLRHATASFLLAQGVDTKVIQQTLRHSRHATTADIYAHVSVELQRQAAETMDAVIRGLGPTA